MPKRLGVTLPDSSAEQLAALQKQLDMTQVQVLILALDRLSRSDMPRKPHPLDVAAPYASYNTPTESIEVDPQTGNILSRTPLKTHEIENRISGADLKLRLDPDKTMFIGSNESFDRQGTNDMMFCRDLISAITLSPNWPFVVWRDADICHQKTFSGNPNAMIGPPLPDYLRRIIDECA